jgi:hypothetical protein
MAVLGIAPSGTCAVPHYKTPAIFADNGTYWPPPNLAHVASPELYILPYHEVSSEWLYDTTWVGLLVAGIRSSTMGLRRDGKDVLSSSYGTHYQAIFGAPVEEAWVSRMPRRPLILPTPHARDEALQVLRAAAADFVLIDRALHAAGNTWVPDRHDLAAFPTEVLIEAAQAFTVQMEGLRILARSARAHRGFDQSRIASYLDTRFDEKAADLIADGAFILECDDIELALGCFPVLQLALHIFHLHHAPHLSPVEFDDKAYYYDAVDRAESITRRYEYLVDSHSAYVEELHVCQREKDRGYFRHMGYFSDLAWSGSGAPPWRTSFIEDDDDENLPAIPVVSSPKHAAGLPASDCVYFHDPARVAGNGVGYDFLVMAQASDVVIDDGLGLPAGDVVGRERAVLLDHLSVKSTVVLSAELSVVPSPKHSKGSLAPDCVGFQDTAFMVDGDGSGFLVMAHASDEVVDDGKGLPVIVTAVEPCARSSAEPSIASAATPSAGPYLGSSPRKKRYKTQQLGEEKGKEKRKVAQRLLLVKRLALASPLVTPAASLPPVVSSVVPEAEPPPGPSDMLLPITSSTMLLKSAWVRMTSEKKERTKKRKKKRTMSTARGSPSTDCVDCVMAFASDVVVGDGLLSPDCVCFQDTAYIDVVVDALGLPASDVVGSEGAVLLDSEAEGSEGAVLLNHLSVKSMVVLSAELPGVPSPKHAAGLLAPDCVCFQDTAYVDVVVDALGLPASDVVGSEGAVLLDHLSVKSMVVLSAELPVAPSPRHSAGLLAPDCVCFQDTAYIEVVDDGLGLPASAVVGSDGAVLLDHLSVKSMVVLSAELPVVPSPMHSAGLLAPDCVCFQVTAYIEVVDDGLGLPASAVVGSDGAVLLDHLSVKSMVVLSAELPVVPSPKHSAGLLAPDCVWFQVTACIEVDGYEEGSDLCVMALASDEVVDDGQGLPASAVVGSDGAVLLDHLSVDSKCVR